MSTANAYMTIHGIDIDVIFKDIKNLHIGVYPPFGRVRVAAPDRLDDEQIRLAVIQRLPWIRRQRDQLLAADRQAEGEMVTGESHYLWGRRYRLKVVERPGRPQVEVEKKRIVVRVPPGSSRDARLTVLQRWQREKLREQVPSLIEKWEPIIGRSVTRWSIRRMKTKWGSCNRATGHIWFNLELATKHPDCLEYITVHEMAHLLERSHGEQFVNLMDNFLPDWRNRREHLNLAPLGHRVWSY